MYHLSYKEAASAALEVVMREVGEDGLGARASGIKADGGRVALTDEVPSQIPSIGWMKL